MPSYVQRLQGWLKHPFSQEMDAIDYALFTIFIVTVAFLWAKVLRNLGQLPG